jgi:sulfonate dioxygenase
VSAINEHHIRLIEKPTVSFFGRLHIHPTSGHPKGYPYFHLVYRDAKGTLNYELDKNLTTSAWHSDVTYEEQPPGLTTLWLYDSPESGGDTAYVNQVDAYKRLSPSFRSYLETLQAEHSGVEQANFSRRGNRGGTVRREPVENVHPVVR